MHYRWNCTTRTKFPVVLPVDSIGLYYTITNIHEGHVYRLCPTVFRVSESYESGEIYSMKWITGREKIADAFEKRNLATIKMLNETMVTVLIVLNILVGDKRIEFTHQIK